MNALIGFTWVTPEVHGNGMVTCHNGKVYNLLDLKPSDVDVDFIFETLSKFPRFLGHTIGWIPYSVGQHSYMMAEAILLATGDIDSAWDALFHDASEAYTGDMMRPLKGILPQFKEIEEKIEKVIFDKLGVEFPLKKLVKAVDLNICEYELTFIMNPTDQIQRFPIWTAEETYKNLHSMFSRLERLKRTREIIQERNGK